jgi:flavodoxin I
MGARLLSAVMPDISVIVFSRGGNTRKIAGAIAEELGVPVQDTNAPFPRDARLVFLGSGTYGGKPGEPMEKFIESENFSGKEVALFCTSGGQRGAEHMMGVMREALLRKGATVIGDFSCRGKFLFTNRGRPNTEDLANAKKFAREMAKLA